MELRIWVFSVGSLAGARNRKSLICKYSGRLQQKTTKQHPKFKATASH